MAGSNRRRKHRRHRRRSSTSSGLPQVPSVGDDELISPKQARDDIRAVLLETIDEAAKRLKEIPRRPPSQHSQQAKRSDSQKTLKSDSSEARCSEVCRECGQKPLQLPISHGVFPKSEPLYCRDRYFVCNGKNMFTREIFSAQGRPLRADRRRLNELRGLPPPKNLPRESSSPAPSRVNTVVVQNVRDDAKGMTLQLRVKLLKPGGEAKNLDLAIEMPDFEPSCVRVGQKTAFLE